MARDISQRIFVYSNTLRFSDEKKRDLEIKNKKTVIEAFKIFKTSKGGECYLNQKQYLFFKYWQCNMRGTIYDRRIFYKKKKKKKIKKKKNKEREESKEKKKKKEDFSLRSFYLFVKTPNFVCQ